jgi:hypothetical protein
MNTLKNFKSLFAGAAFILLAMLIIPFNINAQSSIKGDATDDVKQKIQELNHNGF